MLYVFSTFPSNTLALITAKKNYPLLLNDAFYHVSIIHSLLFLEIKRSDNAFPAGARFLWQYSESASKLALSSKRGGIYSQAPAKLCALSDNSGHGDENQHGQRRHRGDRIDNGDVLHALLDIEIEELAGGPEAAVVHVVHHHRARTDGDAGNKGRDRSGTHGGHDGCKCFCDSLWRTEKHR